MRKSDKQNALAVAAVALCFMITLGLCYLIGGEGFLLAFNRSDGEVKCYLLCSGLYENVTLARNAAELVKSRGGAGYVVTGDACEVVLSAYAEKEDAEAVLQNGGAGSGAYIKEVTVGEISTEWASDAFAEEAEDALGYYDTVFECLYESANGLAGSTLTLTDVRTSVAVCRARVEDLREKFNAAAAGRAPPSSNSRSSPPWLFSTMRNCTTMRAPLPPCPRCAISACSLSSAAKRFAKS